MSGPVRPLPPGDEPVPAPSRPRGGVAFLALAGAAGVAVGLVAGTIAARSPETTVTATTGSPLETTVPTTTTEPVADEDPVADPPPPPTLSDLVPGFTGALRLAVAGTPQGRVWTWPATQSEPAQVRSPAGADLVSFDAGGQWAATMTVSGLGNALYLGSEEDFLPAYIGVTGFAWHATEPGRLAWLGAAEGDGVPLFTGHIDAGGFDFAEITRLDIDPDGGDSLIAWGDWGFALFRRTPDPQSPERPVSLVTLGPEGDRLGADLLDLVAVHPDGTLFVQGPGFAPAYFTTQPDLAELTPVDWPFPGGAAVWSHDGTGLAFGVDKPLSAALRVEVPGGTSYEQLIDTEDAVVLGWSDDDRFVLLWSPTARVRDGRGQALLFVDVLDRSVNVVPFDGSLQAAALRP